MINHFHATLQAALSWRTRFFSTLKGNELAYMQDWIYIIIVGGLAGWLGSFLFRGRGSGLIWNVILGVIGAVVGGWIFEKLNIQVSGLSGTIITAAVGAFVVLWVYMLITGGSRK